MKSLKHTLLVVALLVSARATADFSDAQLTSRPFVPHAAPFVIELKGTWQGSCHPGIAEPVITRVEGTEIEIDLVLDPLPPCLPEVASPYRVLVDMSLDFDFEELDPKPTSDLQLDVTFHFLGETYTEKMLLGCFGPAACPLSSDRTLPEPGLYYAGLAKQGLLLARQDNLLAAYPLVYDENGSAEWLFAGGAINRDTYFAPLYQASGGRCLGCPPPDDPPTMETVGHIAMVFDSEGVAQVKVNDGPFIEHHAMEFGYGSVNGLPDLSGRWALVDTRLEIKNVNGSVPPGVSLPLVFDLIETRPPTTGGPPAAGARFTLRDADGEDVTTAVCGLDDETGLPGCIIENPDYDDGSHSFAVEILSPERIRLTDLGPMLAVDKPATGIAVRID